MKLRLKNLKMPLLIVAVCLIVAGGGVTAMVRYFNNEKHDQPLVFSDNSMLYELWEDYKDRMLEEGTYRAIDRSQDNITTSEGQSYSMLRAVWMDDRQTFNRSWKWTKDNLQRDDKLLSWKFGPTGNGQYGIQTDKGGANTASDADVDTALSLLMAYKRWNDSSYLADARPLIDSIWEKEVVVVVGGKPTLAANDVEKASNNDAMVVNPSYFAPYSFKLFAEADKNKDHDWKGLADNSYDLINKSISMPLDKSTSAGLVPDWINVSKRTGAISASQITDTTTNYAYDAMRTPWRLALDWQWNKDPRAKKTLQKMDFLKAQWNSQKKLAATYTHDGIALATYESPATYGGSIGYFTVTNPALAKQIYNQKLSRVYDPDTQAAKEALNYYDANWSWFGIALVQGALPNLAEN